MAPDSESCTAVIMRTRPGKNSDHQRHALNGQFWATKGLGQGSSISCQLLCCKAGAGLGLVLGWGWAGEDPGNNTHTIQLNLRTRGEMLK